MKEPATLLVVDDEDVICRSCTKIFERQGFRVDSSTSPVEGLRLAEANTYDAILLDIMMPEVGGLEFLEQLRAARPEVPVIIITGFSSVESAARAMRLRAADYVPKPFTPDEISAAVSRVLAASLRAPSSRSGATTERVAPAPTAPAWRGTGAFRFSACSWAELGADGTMRVGLLQGSDMARHVTGVRTAAVGDFVHEGLPVAELALPDGRSVTAIAPVSGTVVEVNGALADDPTRGWDDPCGAGWLVGLVPANGAAEASTARPRRLVMLTAPGARTSAEQERFARLGCQLFVVSDEEAAMGALGGEPAALLVDAESLGTDGPALVGRIQRQLPGARVSVLAGPAAQRWLPRYRQHRILYAALAPLSVAERIDLCDALFRPTEPTVAAPAHTGVLPTGICSVRVVNRQGQTVSLLAPGGVLRASRGIGRRIVERLLEGGYPIRVTLGSGPLQPEDLTRAAALSDRVVVVELRDTGRLAGSLTRETRPTLAARAGEAGAKAVGWIIQPPAGEREGAAADERHADALAAAIVAELVAAAGT